MKLPFTILALAGVFALGICQAVFGTWSEAPAPSPNPPGHDTTVAASDSTGASADADPMPSTGSIAEPAAAEPAPDPSAMLELPDGSFVPTLNGAVDAAPLATYWGPQPFSPIVGVKRCSAGVEWYEHQNGSFSTTQMVWRPDLGRYDAMTRVAHVGPSPAALAAGTAR